MMMLLIMLLRLMFRFSFFLIISFAFIFLAFFLMPFRFDAYLLMPCFLSCDDAALFSLPLIRCFDVTLLLFAIIVFSPIFHFRRAFSLSICRRLRHCLLRFRCHAFATLSPPLMLRFSTLLLSFR